MPVRNRSSHNKSGRIERDDQLEVHAWSNSEQQNDGPIGKERGRKEDGKRMERMVRMMGRRGAVGLSSVA
jgi:hypothetical protein